MGRSDIFYDRIGDVNTYQHVYQLCKEFLMTIPITLAEEKCTATDPHILCYRVQCNMFKKCYINELKKKEEEKSKKS